MPQNKNIKNKITALTYDQCANNFKLLNEDYQSPEEWISIFPIPKKTLNSFENLPHSLLLFNARYWDAAISVIEKSIDHKNKQTSLIDYNRETLFGRLNLNDDQSIEFVQGEIYRHNYGYLILDIAPLLVDPTLWFSLKKYLLTNNIVATSAVNATKFKTELPSSPLGEIHTKIILIAQMDQLEHLSLLDPQYTNIPSLFAELSSDLQADPHNIKALRFFCEELIERKKLTALTNDAYILLFQYLAQKSEDQNRLLFSPALIEELIRYAALFNPSGLISNLDLQKALDERSQSQSLAQEYSERGIIENQIRLQLEGSVIGQVNGLSVVELLGYPCEFGEVFRISASYVIGDGEIVDIERKVELAGNIHAKSTMIVQGYLNHFFTCVSSFPFSCNLVFEQSYQENDGDSASVAMLLAATSCYSHTPIMQNIFVTGSLDQQGNILAIGGINQKIKAVTRLFELGLIDSQVKILMPKANQLNLTLEANTIELIKAEKLLIYPLDHCEEAFPIAMGRSFDDVLYQINENIEKFQKHEHENTGIQSGFFSKFLNIFS